MNLLKNLLKGLLAIVVLLCIVSLFLPSKVHLERSTSVDAPASAIFQQVNNLKNWDNWSPWHKLDPDAKYTYGEQTEGKDAWYSWKGNPKTVGEGKLTITDSKASESIETYMDFGSQGTATSGWIFVEKNGKTEVTWDFDTDLGMNPIAKFFGTQMESMLGPQYEEGLASIKEVSEKQHAADLLQQAAAAEASADSLATDDAVEEGDE